MKTQENRISKVKSGIMFATPPFSAIKKTDNAENFTYLFGVQCDAICIDKFMRLLRNVN